MPNKELVGRNIDRACQNSLKLDRAARMTSWRSQNLAKFPPIDLETGKDDFPICYICGNEKGGKIIINGKIIDSSMGRVKRRVYGIIYNWALTPNTEIKKNSVWKSGFDMKEVRKSIGDDPENPQIIVDNRSSRTQDRRYTFKIKEAVRIVPWESPFPSFCPPETKI